MQVLKWIGSFIAAIGVLAVLGIVGAALAGIMIGVVGAVAVSVTVLVLASIIRSAFR